jgi:subtilisin family serine protease
MKAGALPNPTSGFVPGELVVSFRPGLERAEARDVHSGLGSTVVEKLDRRPSTDLVQLPPGASVLDAARAYGRQAEVASAEPNWFLYPAAVPNDTAFDDQWGLNNTGQSHPISDSQSATSSGTSDADIDAPEAWDEEMGDQDTVIAVIDSGVDVGHPDLAGNLWTNPGDPPGGGDQDGNGLVDDVNGWDFAQNDNNLLDSSAIEGYDHGTHVSGTIAAVTDNNAGVSGVCGGDSPAQGCRIMVLKFMTPFDPPGPQGPVMVGTLADELEAIVYAQEMGADIINASYSAPSWSAAERNALKAAGTQSGILTVVAASNDSLDNDMKVEADFFGGPAPESFSPQYPASYNLPHIISVAASNDEDRYGYVTGCASGNRSRAFCAFSSFGRYSVDLAAPGVDILSTVPSGPGYDTFNGTSMAAPHVSGVAGLLKSDNPSLTALQIKNMIMNGAERTGPLNTQLDTLLFVAPNLNTETPQFGRFTRTAGRLNAELAMEAATTDASESHDGDIPGAVGIARRKVGTVNWPNDVNDIFKKKLRRGETYRMTLSVPPGRDFDLYLIRPGTVEVWQRGSVLRSSLGATGANESISFQAKRSKIHFIHVSSWFTDGSYTLRVRCTTC